MTLTFEDSPIVTIATPIDRARLSPAECSLSFSELFENREVYSPPSRHQMRETTSLAEDIVMGFRNSRIDVGGSEVVTIGKDEKLIATIEACTLLTYPDGAFAPMLHFTFQSRTAENVRFPWVEAERAVCAQIEVSPFALLQGQAALQVVFSDQSRSLELAAYDIFGFRKVQFRSLEGIEKTYPFGVLDHALLHRTLKAAQRLLHNPDQ